MLDLWTPPTLETPRLWLRPLDEGDADDVFTYASNPHVTRYTLWDAHRTRHDSLAFVNGYASSRYAEGVPEPMGLVLKSRSGGSNSERPTPVIGAIGCHWANRPNRCMELGFALGEPYWGRGLTAEAGQALVGYVFAEFGIERLQAHCVVENAASARVLEKVGLRSEGTARSALFHRGRFWDVRHYAVLRSEW